MHARSQVLNSLYEDAFPGLRFITFVNGRSRADIVPEIEVRPALDPLLLSSLPSTAPSSSDSCLSRPQSLLSLSLPPPSPSTPEPRLSDLRARLRVSPAGSQAWRSELERGLGDMWAIAKDRVRKMGVE